MFELELDLASALAAPRNCPRCASDRLTPVVREGVVTFRCQDCRRVWACELGTLVARVEIVDVDRVPGARMPIQPDGS
jgi:transposase-like protein